MLISKGSYSVGVSSRLRQAYVAAKLWHFEHLTTRARHSEATAACSSGAPFGTHFLLVRRMSRTLPS
jgi:hypothetical protein